MSSSFDPGAAADPNSGIFGLPFSVDESKVIVVPVPFAATTSYGGGAERGPEAIFSASKQIDLFDAETGRPYESKIAMLDIPETVLAWHAEARPLAERVIEHGGDVEGDAELENAVARVNAFSEKVNEHVYTTCRKLVSGEKLIALIGGDHSVPFGAIRAIAEAHGSIGILHVDAHADLRKAFEGFNHSHASIMNNVVTSIPQVSKLVQVGLRDLSEVELDMIENSGGRISAFLDHELANRQFRGETWFGICEQIVAALPERVYISFDIDGLDPLLCPHTGTPVPGGLSFHQANALIAAVAQSGRTIVGVDLNEVAASVDGDEWDGNVGARVLYKLIGWMLVSHKLSTPRPRREVSKR